MFGVLLKKPQAQNRNACSFQPQVPKAQTLNSRLKILKELLKSIGLHAEHAKHPRELVLSHLRSLKPTRLSDCFSGSYPIWVIFRGVRLS